MVNVCVYPHFMCRWMYTQHGLHYTVSWRDLDFRSDVSWTERSIGHAETMVVTGISLLRSGKFNWLLEFMAYMFFLHGMISFILKHCEACPLQRS